MPCNQAQKAWIARRMAHGGEAGGPVKQNLPTGVMRTGPGTQHLGWQSQRHFYKMGQGAGHDVEGGLRPSATVQGPRTPSGVRTFAQGGEVSAGHSGCYCPACGYEHSSLSGDEIAGVSPPANVGEMILRAAQGYAMGGEAEGGCPACGYAYGGEVDGDDGEVEPSNLDETVNDPEEERRRYAFALMRGGY